MVSFCGILSLNLVTILRAGTRAGDIAGDAETAEGVVVTNRVASVCAAVGGAGVFEEDEDGGRWLPAGDKYYGEVTFTMSYKDKKSDPFSWLYLDQHTLQRAANANHLNCEIVSLGEHFDYLARLTL